MEYNITWTDVKVQRDVSRQRWMAVHIASATVRTFFQRDPFTAATILSTSPILSSERWDCHRPWSIQSLSVFQPCIATTLEFGSMILYCACGRFSLYSAMGNVHCKFYDTFHPTVSWRPDFDTIMCIGLCVPSSH